MQNLYEQYFMQFFGNLTPAERHEIFVAKQKAERLGRLQAELPDYPWMGKLVEDACKAGHKVSSAIIFDKTGLADRPHRTRITVSGTHCALNPIRSVASRDPTRKQRYGVVQFQPKTLEAISVSIMPIVVPNVRWRVLIIPRDELWCLATPDASLIKAHIALRDGAGIRQRARRLEWEKYENRWDLIPVAA